MHVYMSWCVCVCACVCCVVDCFYTVCYSSLLSRLTVPLLNVILNAWLAFHSSFWISTAVVYSQCCLVATWLVPHGCGLCACVCSGVCMHSIWQGWKKTGHWPGGVAVGWELGREKLWLKETTRCIDSRLMMGESALSCSSFFPDPTTVSWDDGTEPSESAHKQASFNGLKTKTKQNNSKKQTLVQLELCLESILFILSQQLTAYCLLLDWPIPTTTSSYTVNPT